jgi:prolyl-tRNA editing enzyme YbaK/EbsC (Cys-tRNA(Pro) deacylase)|tara:strand:- start:65 stop:553 length:489 start_codon:yes stop_codon:yes gene_type:complete
MGNLLERKSVLVVKNYLRAIDSTIKLIELDTTARTAKDAAQSLKVELGCIVKSLVFKSLKKNLYYLCLVSGDKFISEKKLSLIIDDEIEKASADQTKNYTGYSIGGVPPVGHSNSPTQIFIDSNLKRFEKIYAAAGHPYVVFGMTFEQICKLTNGKIIDYVE